VITICLTDVVPIQALVPLEVDLKQLPVHSWEYAQIPQHRRGQLLFFAALLVLAIDVPLLGSINVI
jgi:hypothetical protein